MALADKGIVAGDHYDLAPPPPRTTVANSAPAAARPAEDDHDGGVNL